MDRVEVAEAVKNYIQSIVPFTQDELDVIMPHFKPMSLPAGEFFVDEGLISKNIGFITKGYLRTYYDINDQEVTTMVLSKHNVVSAHASFTLTKPSKAYIQAITDSELLVMSKESMEWLYKEFPKWERMGRIIMEEVYAYMESRVVDYLSLTPEERYLKMLENDAKLLKNVPLRYIASMLGVTPETLSRIRNKVHKSS